MSDEAQNILDERLTDFTARGLYETNETEDPPEEKIEEKDAE